MYPLVGFAEPRKLLPKGKDEGASDGEGKEGDCEDDKEEGAGGGSSDREHFGGMKLSRKVKSC